MPKDEGNVPLKDDEFQSDTDTELSDIESENKNELNSSFNIDYILREIDDTYQS